MKKLRITAFVVAALTGVFFPTAQAEVKIASVDMVKLYKTYYKTAKVEETVKVRNEEMSREIKSRQKKLEALQDEANKLQRQMDPTLSETQVKKLREKALSVQNEMVALDRELRSHIQACNTAMQDFSQRGFMVLNKEITEMVQTVAKEEGYDVVIDSSAVDAQMGLSVFPYVGPSLDITEKVSKRLNADAPTGDDARKVLQRLRGENNSGTEQGDAK